MLILFLYIISLCSCIASQPPRTIHFFGAEDLYYFFSEDQNDQQTSKQRAFAKWGFELEYWDIARTAAQKLGYRFTTQPLPQDGSLVYGVIFCNTHGGGAYSPLPYTTQQQFKQHYPHAKIVSILFDPHCVVPSNADPHILNTYDLVFTGNDKLVDSRKFHKFFFSHINTDILEPPIPFEDKKFCCIIAGAKGCTYPKELYSERLKTICFFEKCAPGYLDFYGKGWETTSCVNFKTYKGIVADKLNTLRQYKFCICYENIQIPGYISEKIQHCLLTGCIPIYWGAPDIEEYIPANCFINRKKFHSNEDLFYHLARMTENEYRQYLANIQVWLKSAVSKLFSPLHFAECFLKALLPDYDRNKAFTEEQRRLLEKIDTHKRLIQINKLQKNKKS